LSIFFEQKSHLLTVSRYFCAVAGFRSLFDAYIIYNFHVAVAVLALAQITVLDFGLSPQPVDYLLFFTAPFLGYNFIKFYPLGFRPRSISPRLMWGFRGLLLGGAVFLAVAFFLLPFSAQIVFMAAFVLSLLYGWPLPGLGLNFRGFRGWKIHMVALSWVLISVLLPLAVAGKMLTAPALIYAGQRYLYVLAATLPFEIRDLKWDHPQLATWPQKWGVRKTQILGVLLLAILVFLEACCFYGPAFGLTFCIALLLAGMILKSKIDQSPYFSSFWVEGIPILWLTLKGLMFLG
jgi:hypothetical protein